MSSRSVAAVVLSYDGRHLLEIALPSLAAQTLDDVHVLVVDNGSSDGTAEWLAAEWPDVEVVALPVNVGVTAALNAGLKAAAGHEFVALLNNDLELDPNCLAELVGAMRAYPRAGSAGAKLLDFHERDVIDGTGDFLRWTGIATRRGHGQRDAGRYDTPEAVFGACGGAAVYRGAALEDVGLLDAAFFAFSEDVDWALRAQLAGWDCRYVPTAVVYHMGSATLGRGLSDFTAYHLWRNAIWMIAKDFPPSALIRRSPFIAAGFAMNLAAALKGRKLGVWARAMRDAARGLPGALRRRGTVQRKRRRSLAELDTVISRF
ncbi:glycosyltransferase family 2 protein [Solirubrobacter ginsenosidimutans]|uniref:Glycosyltransferase family 2 protein n=1 Tax=Solirubrobacter ginsenosidimutans TaxID=490573 RepID=A0A9X3N0T2_9ACTN|nr:glycosyltransferase family 2 protein [Solirubrobacter ginsenosidimutans]MDA0164722.1 glycosyltransferase family 2 protein [Solirubrobacter ginsenosidimutans]